MTQLSDLTDQITALFADQADKLTAAQMNYATAQQSMAVLSTELMTADATIAALRAQLDAPTLTLFGVDGQPLDIANFPRAAYCREYNRPGAGLKALQAPASVTWPHTSFHDTPTPTVVNPLLDSITRPIILEWSHEPEHDMTTAAYTAGVTALHQIVAAHPNSHLVTIAQTFTRYAQVHGQTMTDGKPATWQNLWVKGSGLIGFDCEIDKTITGYPNPATFFAAAVTAAKTLGVPFIVPELGYPQLASDPDGSGLAAWYTACAAYLRSVDCAAVAAFNVAGTTADYRLSLTPKAMTAWQTVVASQ